MNLQQQYADGILSTFALKRTQFFTRLSKIQPKQQDKTVQNIN